MLVIGLGNPGKEYEWTRHNIGFMLIDTLARESNSEVKRAECQSLVGRAQIEGNRVELVKPQTFMNLSGEAVACLLRKRPDLKPSSDLLVVVDDLALPAGTIRLRMRGSSGGHNGLKSIARNLRTEEYARLRIGIQPDHPIADTARFVLERFPHNARKSVEEVLDRSAQLVRSVIREGIERTMSEYNRIVSNG